MAYLSTHFTEDERSCKHCSMLELDPKLLVLMELVSVMVMTAIEVYMSLSIGRNHASSIVDSIRLGELK